jgi:hypothetical protein
MHGIAGSLSVVLTLAAAPPPEATAREVLALERCQTELPIAGQAQAGASGSDASPSVGRPVGLGGILPPLSVPSSFAAVALTAVLVAVLLAAMLHHLPARTALPPPERAPSYRPAAARPARPRPVGDPEQLARDGRYAEAIHALLLKALAETEPGRERPALTSREIASSARLGRDARAALDALVAAVEWAHFAGQPVGAAEYQASLSEYQRLSRSWAKR